MSFFAPYKYDQAGAVNAAPALSANQASFKKPYQPLFFLPAISLFISIAAPEYTSTLAEMSIMSILILPCVLSPVWGLAPACCAASATLFSIAALSVATSVASPSALSLLLTTSPSSYSSSSSSSSKMSSVALSSSSYSSSVSSSAAASRQTRLRPR